MYYRMSRILNEMNKMSGFPYDYDEVKITVRWLLDQYEESLEQGFPTVEIIEKMNELADFFNEAIIFDDDCTCEDMVEFFKELDYNL